MAKIAKEVEEEVQEVNAVPQIEPPAFSDEDLLNMSPQEREEAKMRREMDQARDGLFAQNNITPEMVAAWKEKHDDVGWTSFIVPGSEHGIIYVYRVIRRTEWKRSIKGHFSQNKVVDPDEQNEFIASYATLWPLDVKETNYWNEQPALIPDTLTNLIMDVSGGDTLTPAMRL